MSAQSESEDVKQQFEARYQSLSSSIESLLSPQTIYINRLYHAWKIGENLFQLYGNIFRHSTNNESHTKVHKLMTANIDPLLIELAKIYKESKTFEVNPNHPDLDAECILFGLGNIVSYCGNLISADLWTKSHFIEYLIERINDYLSEYNAVLARKRTMHNRKVTLPNDMRSILHCISNLAGKTVTSSHSQSTDLTQILKDSNISHHLFKLIISFPNLDTNTRQACFLFSFRAILFIDGSLNYKFESLAIVNDNNDDDHINTKHQSSNDIDVKHNIDDNSNNQNNIENQNENEIGINYCRQVSNHYLNKQSPLHCIMKEWQCGINHKGVTQGEYVFYPDAWDRAICVSLLLVNPKMLPILLDYGLLNIIEQSLIIKENTIHETVTMYFYCVKIVHSIILQQHNVNNDNNNQNTLNNAMVVAVSEENLLQPRLATMLNAKDIYDLIKKHFADIDENSMENEMDTIEEIAKNTNVVFDIIRSYWKDCITATQYGRILSMDLVVLCCTFLW